MTLDKAIEALTHPVYRIGIVPDRDFIKALRLSIEALERIKQLRAGTALSVTGQLLGETEK